MHDYSKFFQVLVQFFRSWVDRESRAYGIGTKYESSFDQNKKLGYFGFKSSALVCKTETTAKWKKKQLRITLEVLHEVFVEFPEKIRKEMSQRKYISGRVIYFFTSLEAKS